MPQPDDENHSDDDLDLASAMAAMVTPTAPGRSRRRSIFGDDDDDDATQPGEENTDPSATIAAASLSVYTTASHTNANPNDVLAVKSFAKRQRIDVEHIDEVTAFMNVCPFFLIIPY